MNNPGKVYLVGAGPGAPDLITLRGWKALTEAQVVLYDRLVHPDLLRSLAPDVRCLYAGKDLEGSSRDRQERIHQQMKYWARQGLTVVRLKGGDPFLFGRGGEEALALAEAGLDFEVIPGLPSATAVPSTALMGLTHRGIATSVGFFTARGAENEHEPDWDAVVALDTVVFMMGVRRLPLIQKRLLDRGKPPSTPLAILMDGTWATELQIITTLGTLDPCDPRLKPPGIIMLGEGVRLPTWIRKAREARLAQSPDRVVEHVPRAELACNIHEELK